MKRLFAIACLFVSASCAMAAMRPPQSKVVSLEQLHGRAALIGQEVEVVSCAGIPLSDAPNQENLIIIYPCGTELSDEVSKKAVAGRLSAQTVLKPSKEWAIDSDDEEKGLVIELDEVEFHSAVDL
ncbi:hypothetical protein [Rhodanobacter sp. C01]|uniref:hypothetical protein n=1 Tax=Rhodanobacter sp. C01 TaxID=1945856 RepID=UPI000984317D|nr:hypothetical protein [Rhodanobacter sp. C01]OOG48513.1 hypothetical protein B0E50_07850 [Rhodanobacter sp. C01]